MEGMRIAVCDDVQEDAMLLTGYLKEIISEARVDIYEDGCEFIENFTRMEKVYDLIFLDVHMPKLNGIDTAKEIRKKDLFVPIIFVTVSDKFYREAYDIFAFNYLIKPLKKERLEYVLYLLMCKNPGKEERVLNFRYRSQVHTLKLSEIVYISSSLHTVNFYLKGGRSVHCRGKLIDFAEQLKDSTFLRCHQSFYVNMTEIISMKADSFQVKDGIIPISRSYAKQVQEAYRKYLSTIRDTAE